MAYVTTEERVDRLEALFGQFLTEMAVISHRAEQREKQAQEREKEAQEREKLAQERFAGFQAEIAAINTTAEERNRAAEERNRAAEERNLAAEERNRAAEERNRAAEERMARFEAEMREFKDEMRASKRALDKKWGDLANKMGTIIEDLVAPNLRRLAIEHFGFPAIEDYMLRRSRRLDGKETEFDTLVVGANAVVLGEAKSSPSVACAEAFAAKAGRFFEFFPEYRGRRLIPVFGSWSVPDPVVERLTELKIYAMRMGEDTMELANAAALEAPGGTGEHQGRKD